jgi:hypothetical protein
VLIINFKVGTTIANISAVAHSPGYDSPAKAVKRFITTGMTHNTVPAVHQTDTVHFVALSSFGRNVELGTT